MAILKKLTDKLLHELTGSCKKHYGGNLISIVVYGSVARYVHTYYSDIDILLIVDNLPDGRMSRMNDFAEIENELSAELTDARNNGWHVDLSPIIRKPDEINAGGYLYLDMVDDALILHDQNNFFAEYLNNLRNRLHEYGAEKKRWKGGYYWEIKPDLKPEEVINL